MKDTVSINEIINSTCNTYSVKDNSVRGCHTEYKDNIKPGDKVVLWDDSVGYSRFVLVVEEPTSDEQPTEDTDTTTAPETATEDTQTAEPAPATDEPAADPEPEQPATGYTVSRNEQFNSVEITFTSKPGDAVRDALKARGFRWHRARGLWYGYTDADEITAAINAAMQGDATPASKTPKAAKPAPVNKYGVKVGDLFRCSWGYDQTQNDFYQVIALCGSSSVRVREVCPEMIESRGISWGAEDRIYNTNTHGELLPPVENSCFIKDQERGDLKKLKSYAADGVSNPQFAVSSYANAYHCGTDTTKVYESWYR